MDKPVAWRFRPDARAPWSITEDGYYASCMKGNGYTVEPMYLAPQPAAPQVQAEPVAWMLERQNMGGDTSWVLSWSRSGAGVCNRLAGEQSEKPLYTHPQPAKREPLTYEELEAIGKQQDPCVLLHHNVLAFARAIEAAHGIGSLCDSGMANTAGDTAAELRRLQAENEKLEKALRYHILIYRVADEAWNQEAEVDRIMKMVLGSGE